MELVLTDTADPEVEKAILDPLKAYNIARFGESGRRDLQISIRDEERRTVGGLTGHTGRGWLYVQMLFIPEALRGKGLAGKLLAMAETEAKARGCTGSYIDTMNPEALKVYLRQGYEIVGTLPGLEGGHAINWLAKRF